MPKPMQVPSRVHATSTQSPCDIAPKSMRHRSPPHATTPQSPCDYDPKSMRLRSQVHATSPQSPCDLAPKCVRVLPEASANSIQTPWDSPPKPCSYPLKTRDLRKFAIRTIYFFPQITLPDSFQYRLKRPLSNTTQFHPNTSHHGRYQHPPLQPRHPCQKLR